LEKIAYNKGHPEITGYGYYKIKAINRDETVPLPRTGGAEFGKEAEIIEAVLGGCGDLGAEGINVAAGGLQRSRHRRAREVRHFQRHLVSRSTL
jgi:hypothetical protein